MSLPLVAPHGGLTPKAMLAKGTTRHNPGLGERQEEQRKKLLARAFTEHKAGNFKMAKTLAAFLCEAYADPDAYMVLAASAQKLGEEDLAFSAYEMALQAKPDDLSLNVGYAELCIKLMRYDAAEARLKHCIEKDPRAEHPAGAKARVLVLRVEQLLEKGHQ